MLKGFPLLSLTQIMNSFFTLFKSFPLWCGILPQPGQVFSISALANNQGVS
jgi:hypothetical protein